ncbi:hypothetical protein BG015_006859 [Linnemannia schmuckeri]|uniref:Uncharacterized protein n=1 Tax=Linnemannia schmuckeri TaxID=64567 RepID=A0A9P5RZM6_9FUNG|nr:hypothetical protein BG015_006859 [Linnemannia schmuckeri]
MSFLVKLCIHKLIIDGRTLSTIVKVCRSLERFYFDLQEGDSHEMVDLLIKGTTSLKTCEGKGHVVLVEDLIDSAEWTCVGLEKLDNEVFGVPRPMRDQEKLLDKLWSLDPVWFKVTTDGATTIGKLQDIDPEQARQRLRQLGHKLTSNEAEALEQRRASHTILRKVYQRLGYRKRKQLRQLGFISEPDRPIGGCDRFDGLEFDLMCSLGGQDALEHLMEIYFSQPKARYRQIGL